MQLCVFCDLREVWKSTNLIKWEQSTNFFQKFLWFSQFNKLQHNIWEKTLTSALYLQVQPNPQQSSLHICSVNLKFFFFSLNLKRWIQNFFFQLFLVYKFYSSIQFMSHQTILVPIILMSYMRLTDLSWYQLLSSKEWWSEGYSF